MAYIPIQEGERETLPSPQYPGPGPQPHDSGKMLAVTDIHARAGRVPGGHVVPPAAPSSEETCPKIHVDALPRAPAPRSEGMADTELPDGLRDATVYKGTASTERPPATCLRGLQELEGQQEMERKAGGGRGEAGEELEEGGSHLGVESAEEASGAEELEGLLRPGDAAEPRTMLAGSTKGMLAWSEGVTRSIWNSGTACILLASTVQAASAVFVKQMAGRLPTSQIVVGRSLICFAMTIPVARISGIRPVFGTRRHWRRLFQRGLVGALSLTLYYEAVRLLPLADAMTLFFANSAITALLAWIILGQPLRLLSLIGICASLVGVALIAHPPFLFGETSWNTARLFGTLAGLASAVLGATAYILIQFIPHCVPSLVVALWFHSMAILTMLPALLVGFPKRAVVPGVLDGLRLAGVGLTSFAAQLMLNRAFRLEPASKMATMSLVQVLYAHVLGILIFNDAETLLGLIGAGLLAFGVASVSFGGSTRKEPNQDTLPLNAAADRGEALTVEAEGKLELIDTVPYEESAREARQVSSVPQGSGVEMRYADWEEEGSACSGTGVMPEPPLSIKGASPNAV